MNHPIPILLYHRIERSPLSTATAPEVFRRHLQFLKERGWRSLSAEQFGFIMRTGRPAPPQSFLITFDDGYESVATVALDILREFDFKAISFLSTKFVHDAHPDKRAPQAGDEADAYLSWRQVRQLQSSGFVDCQSHSHAHENFSGRTLDEVRDDLAISIDMLAHGMGLPKRHFTHLAWPWGLSMPEWRAAAKSLGFQYQYTVARQSFRAGDALDEIPRTCFDAASFGQFQRQLWLQSGQFAQLWNIAYPFGRKLRRLPAMFR